MRTTRFQYFFIALVLFYLLLTFFTPIDPATTARFGLSEFQVRLIGMSISIPMAGIWLIALYGYTRFQAYSDMIRKEKEGKAFQEITKGLMILTLSLPTATLITAILRRVALDVPSVGTIVPFGRSFAPMLFQVFALSILASGSLRLLGTLKPKVKVKYTRSIIVGLIAVCCIFTYVITARPFGGSVSENYAAPEWLVIAALVIPFLYAWQRGAVAVYNFYLYKKHVHGPVYSKMLTNLVSGLSIIILSSIFIQVVTSVSQNFQRLNFTPILISVYVLIFVYGVGFVLLARGARQLRKIEEV
jgi:hypothetical protein